MTAERHVNGGVLQLSALGTAGDQDGQKLFIAAINNSLQAFRIDNHDLADGPKYTEGVCVVGLATFGDFIAAADLMRSAQLLVYRAADQTIAKLAGDVRSTWLTSLSMFDADRIVGAEDFYNLFVWQRNENNPTVAATTAGGIEWNQLEVIGQYHTGEMINRFRQGIFFLFLCCSCFIVLLVMVLAFGEVMRRNQ